MALNILNKEAIALALTRMWQQDLHTTQDPANRRVVRHGEPPVGWLEDSPTHDGKGLIGGLSDSYENAVLLTGSQKNYQPSQVFESSTMVDNRNGLNGGTNIVKLIYTNSTSVTVTISSKLAIGNVVKFAVVNIPIIGTGGDFTLTVNFEVSGSQASTTTNVVTGEIDTQVTVPKGKVYLVILDGSVVTVDIPCQVKVHVAGTTETWFENPVDGHYNWIYDTGSAFGKLRSDGADNYSNNGDGSGDILVAVGTLQAQNKARFGSRIVDITAEMPASGPLPPLPPAGSPALAALFAKGRALDAGSPVPVPTVDPEIVYLCNCYLSDGQKSSEMNYYPKTSLSQHGERPAATAVVATDGTVTWEGHPVVGTFPDGNHFTSNITDHNGPVGAVKGSGFNDYHQFTCRQDSGRLLYSDSNKSCYSIYYCQ